VVYAGPKKAKVVSSPAPLPPPRAKAPTPSPRVVPKADAKPLGAADDRSSRRRLSEGGSARKFPEAVQPIPHDRPPFKRSSKRSLAAAADGGPTDNSTGLTPTGR